MFFIIENCNLALANYLIDSGAGTALDTFPAKLAVDKTGPNTVVDAHRCTEDPPNSGIYKLEVAITVETQSATDAGAATSALTDSLNRLNLVEKALKPSLDWSVLRDAINAASNAAQPAIPFTIQGIADAGREAMINEARTMWIDVIHLEVWGSQPDSD